MAFTEEYYAPERWWDFQFFATGGANGVVSENVAPTTRFKILEFRLHWSSAFASVEDFVVQISSIKGSQYNAILFSEALNGLTDLYVRLSQPMQFLSDDSVNIAMSMASGINIWGLTVVGWAIRG